MPEDKVKNVVMAFSPRRCFFPIPFARPNTPRPKVTDSRRTRLLGKNYVLVFFASAFSVNCSLVRPQDTRSLLPAYCPPLKKRILEESW